MNVIWRHVIGLFCRIWKWNWSRNKPRRTLWKAIPQVAAPDTRSKCFTSGQVWENQKENLMREYFWPNYLLEFLPLNVVSKGLIIMEAINSLKVTRKDAAHRCKGPRKSSVVCYDSMSILLHQIYLTETTHGEFLGFVMQYQCPIIQLWCITR